MSWQFFIPASMGMIGSICLGLALVLVLIDMPGGVNWSKIAGWFAVIGGFGTLGGVAGWLGNKILSGQQNAMSFGQEYGSRLLGSGIVIVILLGAGLWAYKHLFGNGTEAGGKSTWSKKIRSLFKAGLLALVGAMIAGTIPALYDGADWLIVQLHDAIV